MALLYKKDKISEVKQKNGKTFSARELQDYVGGYFELVQLLCDVIMVCDEEGLLKKNYTNINALQYAQLLGYQYDYLVGDVLFVNKNEIE